MDIYGVINTRMRIVQYTYTIHHKLQAVSVESISNTPMLSSHMIIDTITSRESSQANPAEMSATADASDMVASFGSLDRNTALGAVLHIMGFSPLIEEVVPIIAIRTFEPVMLFNMTLRTYSQ